MHHQTGLVRWCDASTDSYPSSSSTHSFPHSLALSLTHSLAPLTLTQSSHSGHRTKGFLREYLSNSRPLTHSLFPSLTHSSHSHSHRTKGFLREYLSVGDVKEAKLCLSELREAPKAGADVKDLSGVVAAGMDEAFNAQVRGFRQGSVCWF